jgi:predicted ribosome quality control (RQC) complex YloA/Tae2 family protein
MKTIEIYIEKIKDDVTFRIGENAQENYDLIDDSNPDDIWFHLNNNSSSHVVASIPEGLKRKEKGYIIRRGALLCKNDNAKSRTQKQVGIIFTAIRNVKKTDIVGSVELVTSNTITV